MRWTKRIIQHILELWRIYRFTAFVRTKIKKDEDYALEDFCRTQFRIEKKFFYKKDIPKKACEELVAQAKERGFLENNKVRGLDHLKITALGRDLIEMKGLGLVVVASKKYQILLTVISVVATVTSVIILITR